MATRLINRLKSLRRPTRLHGSAFAALALAGSLAAAAPAHGASAAARSDGKGQATSGNRGSRGDDQDYQGVVQLVSSRGVVLKELDGSIVTVPLDARTRIIVNGRKSVLREVKPGFVATARWKSGRPADRLEAVDPGQPDSNGAHHGKTQDELRLPSNH